MRCRFAGDEDGVVLDEAAHERQVFLGEVSLAVVPLPDLGAEHAVAFTPRISALYGDLPLDGTRDAVKEARLLQQPGEKMTFAADDRVRRPDEESVAPALLELLGVKEALAPSPIE